MDRIRPAPPPDPHPDRELTPTEALIAKVWQEITGSQLGRSDNFFRYGDSLAAARMIARLRSVLPVKVTLAGFLAHPVLEEFAQHVTSLSTGEPNRQVDQPPIRRVTREDPILMAPAQMARASAEGAARQGGRPGPLGFVSLVAELMTPIRDAAIASALQVLVDRHESLRTGLMVEADQGTGRLFISGTADPRLEVCDCRDWPPEMIEQLLEEQHETLSTQPLDLTRPPLWRARLNRLSVSHCLLVLVVDHFVLDGVSVEILFEELVEVLSRRTLGVEPEALDYLDWVHWRDRRLTGAGREELARYWRTSLAGVGPYPDLALPAPTSVPAQASHTVASRLGPHQTANLLSVAAQNGVTPFMACLTAIAVAWLRVRGECDIVVHTPAANRLAPGFARVVGWMAHTIPIRITLPAGTIAHDAMATVRKFALEAMRHQDFRLTDIAAEFPQANHTGVRPPRLYFAFEQIDEAPRSIAGGLIRRIHFPLRAADRAEQRAIAQYGSMSTSGVSIYADISQGRLGLGVTTDPRETAPEFAVRFHEAIQATLEDLSTLENAVTTPAREDDANAFA